MWKTSSATTPGQSREQKSRSPMVRMPRKWVEEGPARSEWGQGNPKGAWREPTRCSADLWHEEFLLPTDSIHCEQSLQWGVLIWPSDSLCSQEDSLFSEEHTDRNAEITTTLWAQGGKILYFCITMSKYLTKQPEGVEIYFGPAFQSCQSVISVKWGICNTVSGNQEGDRKWVSDPFLVSFPSRVVNKQETSTRMAACHSRSQPTRLSAPSVPLAH